MDIAESWQRGDQPVFVFSSLLAQRQFTATDCALDDGLRRGAIEQRLLDRHCGAKVVERVGSIENKMARLDHEMTSAARQAVDQDLAVSVTDAYGRVLAAAGAPRSADAAVAAVRADRELAGNRRNAGLVTDADVLQIEVHLSRAREQQIVAASDERVTRARLNELIGAPLGESFELEQSDVTRCVRHELHDRHQLQSWMKPAEVSAPTTVIRVQ